MDAVIGWDIGGANVKAARVEAGPGGAARVVRDAVVPLAVWRELGRLPDVLAAIASGLGPAGAHAVTMTAELADVFPTRREGVLAVLAAIERALPGAALHVWTTAGRFLPPSAVREHPLTAAASNWVATATWVAARVPDCLLLDVGSTTTDIVPVRGGRVAALAYDDTSRLASGELVYTGVLRSPVGSLAGSVPLGGRWVRLAAEVFAVTGDVHVALGNLTPDEYTAQTPDGRGTGRRECLARLARAVCADLETVTEEQVEAVACYLAEVQAHRVARATLQVLSAAAGAASAPAASGAGLAPDAGGGRRDQDGLPVIGTGLGRFLAREVARRLGMRYLDLGELEPGFGLEGGQVSPAAAVAALLMEKLLPGERRVVG